MNFIDLKNAFKNQKKKTGPSIVKRQYLCQGTLSFPVFVTLCQKEYIPWKYSSTLAVKYVSL